MQISSSKLSEKLKKEMIEEIAVDLRLDPEKITVTSIEFLIDELSYNLHEIEKITLIKALAVSSGNISKTASLLGITRRTVYSLIKKYSIEKFINTHDQ